MVNRYLQWKKWRLKKQELNAETVPRIGNSNRFLGSTVKNSQYFYLYDSINNDSDIY